MNWLVDPKIRQFAELAISKLPDYFFEVAASSTGKFHPSYALGNGGLERHTKAAVKIAHELLGLEMYGRYTPEEKDLMLVALILHDGWKHGAETTAGQYTVAEHPVVCADWIRNAIEFAQILTAAQQSFLCDCIASHMGQWNTDYRSKKEILPKPKTAAQKFVHQADLLASRRWLNVDFEDDYYSGPQKETDDSSATETDADLAAVVKEVVDLCKTLIDSDKVKRNDVLTTVSNLNENNRNPNSIKSIEIAYQVKKALEELNA